MMMSRKDLMTEKPRFELAAQGVFTCSCKKQINFLTALLLGGPSLASAQGPSAP